MNKKQFSLQWLSEEYHILRYAADSDFFPDLSLHSEITVSKNADELSILIPSSVSIGGTPHERSEPLVGFRIVGILDHSLIGVLSGLSQVLAQAEVPIFAVSTFDTDYIYVDKNLKARAETALQTVGYEFV